MIPLVVLDLDGTLIDSSGQVDECVWDAVEELRSVGVKMSVCTGRPSAGVALRVAKRLGHRNPHIFQTGALISDPAGDTLHVAALRESVALQLVEYARELGYTLELYTPTTLYVERKTQISEAHAKMIGVTALVRDLAEVARIEPVVRAQWVVTSDQRAQVEGLPLPGAQLSSANSPALPNTAFVSVTREGVSKGSAVKLLAEMQGVPLRDVMAIGDSEGDVPMLEAVGHPLVMPSAPLAVRERFPVLAKSVEECGVVEALEKALTLERA
ncbi:MAG TPA: Cof-type HAD-IIB family hydrolase [Trueperaceae bacterium]